MDDLIFELHAEICKTFSHAKRLEILNYLREGERSAGEIVRALHLPKSNVSQHLGVLRRKGVVKVRRQGTSLFYCIADPRITKACDLMREVLFAQLRDSQRLVKTLPRR